MRFVLSIDMNGSDFHQGDPNGTVVARLLGTAADIVRGLPLQVGDGTSVTLTSFEVTDDDEHDVDDDRDSYEGR
jgi:hypothetical protein